MARKQVIKPDFTINNINAVNDDKGARALVGGIVRKPAPVVQKFDQTNSNGFSTHKDGLSVAKKTNLTSLNFDGDNDNVEFSNSSDFSFIRTIEQNTINFTHDSANAKVTVADNSTLSMNKSENTVVSNFVKATNNTYYSAADTDDLSFAKMEGETEVISFPGGSTNSKIQVSHNSSLSFVEEVNKTTLSFNGTNAYMNAPDHSGYSFVEDTEVSAVQFSADSNSSVSAADSNDFTFHDGTDDVPFSIAFWVNLTTVGSSTRYIFGKWGSAYLFRYNTDGQILLQMYDSAADGGGAAFNAFASPQVGGKEFFEDSFDTWVHVAIVYTPETGNDTNNEQIQYYKNGSAWGSAVNGSNANYDSSQNDSGKFVLGDYTSTSPTSQRMVGMLSNFLVFKHDGQNNHASVARSTTPLTANEVNGLYNGGKVVKDYNDHPKGADLVAYWKLDEDVSEAGGQLDDYSGENNHINTIGSAVTEDSTSGLSLRQDVSFTWTLWVRKQDKTSLNQRLLYRFDSSNPEYILSIDGRKLKLVLYDTTGMSGTGNYNIREYVTNGTFLSDSITDWEHIAVVYNRDTKEVTFHRNGGSAQTGTANDTQTLGYNDDPTPAAGYSEMQDTNTSLTIGANPGAGAGRFTGQLAQLAMFRHDGGSAVMTTNQVKALYNGGFAYDYRLYHVKKSDLVVYYKFYGSYAPENSLGSTFNTVANVAQMVNSGLKEKQDTDLTFSFWLKRAVQGSSDVFHTIIHKHNEYFLRIGGGVNNTTVQLFKYDDTDAEDGGLASASWGGTVLNNDANWQHIAVTYDASARTARFYRNGVLTVTDSAPSVDVYVESQTENSVLTVGQTQFGGMPLVGELAHVAMFKHDGGSALMSDAEVYKLYDRDGTNGNASSVEGKVWNIHHTHAKAADLVGYWKLNEDVSSTATITDYSGLSNNGATTGVGTTTLTNPANSGLDSADFVDVSFSISFWMKKSSTTGDTQRILAKGTVKGTDAEYMVQRFNRRFYLYVYDNTPTDGAGTYGEAVYYTNTTFLSDNNTDWEHITIVYDASTQNATFYNNGDSAQVITAAFADGDNDYDSMFNGTGLFYIGQEKASSTAGIDGQLAHLAVFKHDGQSGRSSAVPTAAQVKGGYNGGNVYDLNTGTQHPKKADIVGYWKLDGIEATVGGDLTAGAGASTSTATDLKTTTDVDMTFAFWFKKNDTAHSNRTIIGKNNEYQIYLRGNKVNLRIIDAYPSDGGTASHMNFHTTDVATNTTDWQHMVIRYDASAETAYIIVNGGSSNAMTKTSENNFDDFHDGTSAVVMGYDTWIQDGVAYGFGGQIAHLAVYKHDGLNSRSTTMLSQAEAQGLYNGGNVYDYTRHPKAGDLVGYWKLNEDVSSTATITDYSGLTNHGATTGTGTTTLTNPANSGLNEVKDNSFTIGFWMNKDGTNLNDNVIYKTSEYYIRVIGRNLQLVIYDSTDMDSNTEGAASATTATNVLANNTGTWEHVIISYDVANQQVKFFVDGAIADAISISSDSDYNEMQDGSNVLRIGHTHTSFDGKLSNVIMFDHGAAGASFSGDDAEELYSDGYVYDYNNHSRASDIVAWWKLDGNGDDSHTGGSHDGTINGALSAANSGLYEFEDQDFALGFFINPLDSTNLTVTDGDAASGMTEGEKVTITDTSGTAIKYIVCDSNGAGAPSTGTALEVGDDTGTGTAGEAGTAVTIDLTGTPATQNAFLVQLKAAIESSAGHNGSITVSDVPTQASGKQTIFLTNAHKTNVPTDTISQLAIGHPSTRYLFHKISEYYMYYTDTFLTIFMRDTTPKQVGGSIATSTARSFSFNYSLPMNQFTHVVVSYDKSEEKMHLYINGVEQGSGVSPSSDPDYQESGGQQSNFYFGNYATSNTSDAELSHFVIFKGRHLTESEANELYNNGEGYNYLTHSRTSDISVFYKLDETTGNNSTLVDSSGNGNNLSATAVTAGQGVATPKIPGAKKVPQLPMRMSIPGLSSLRTNPQK